MAVADTDVDVDAAVGSIQNTVDELEAEIARDAHALGVKRARLDALKRGQLALEKAVDPDIQPRRRGRRTPA